MSINETFEEIFRKRFGRAPTQEELTVLIDQSVISHNQSGGITAHTVNLGPQQRHVDEHLKHELLSMVDKTREIRVTAWGADMEAQNFAREVWAFLKLNGYEMFSVQPEQIMAGVMPQPGISYNPNGAMNLPTILVGPHP